ncbi:response regulator [Stutzerimonas tarimensis]|uniref:histidine kinase n=1 Tax=Stutzerimonas tarimensis TaxID=1507735 RepID=A0ABV7T669_9GAMM
MDNSFIGQQNFNRILNRNVGLPLAFGFLSVLFFISIVYFLLQTERWVERSVREVALAQETARLLVEQETGMRGYLISQQVIYLEPYERNLAQVRRNFEALRQFVSEEPAQLRRIEQIQDLHTRWMALTEDVIDRKREGLSIVEYTRAGRGRMIQEQMRSLFSDFIAEERETRRARTGQAESITTWLIAGFLLFSVLVSAGLVYSGRRDLLGLSASYSEALEQQQAHAEDLQRQAWYRKGQTELGEAIIGELSLPVLGQGILGFLAHYLDVAVGAVYVLEDARLRRVAEYGYSPEHLNRGRTIALNEGLVGQAARERRILQLDQLPNNYLKVNSALGETPAQSVMLVPVVDSGQLNAVIELGFLHPLGVREAELMKVIAAPIGSAIEAARYRQRLQKALAETQQLNEELQVQQEELRAANEELEVQSTALRETQVHLEEQQAELEQTNEQLSEQTQALSRQRDEMTAQNGHLQQAQLLLEQHTRELQRASRYKSEFLANMSHELRTPLNSTLILAKLLADNPHGNLSTDQVQYARSIYSAGNDLLLLINDILDLSKVEAGKLDIRPEPMRVARLLDGLKELFQPQAMNKAVEYQVEMGTDVPESLFSDRQRIEQILKNLLSNAFKFTESGRVRLTASLDERAMLAFAVQDTGIGIAQEQQDVIFEAFRQADGTTNRRYGGTGLGLSISRELAHLLGGRLEVRSEAGKGSTFTLVVPLQYQPPEPGEPALLAGTTDVAPLPAAVAAPVIAEPVAPAPVASRNPRTQRIADDREAYPFKDRCVLVIEDEPQFAGILRDLAHELRYSCLVEHNADEGFDTALQYRPDAILLDMRLPDHSGLTVLERLKETPETRHIPVHVVSVEDRKEAALHMGAVGYATKPTTRDELKEVFQRLESKLAQKVKRILLVEDDARQRESLSRLIEDVDVQITAVERAEQALDQLRATVFDCMVIDLKLPDMDGYELLERMAQEDICSFPPVIVYTGRNLTRDEEAALMKYSRSIIIKGARSPERLLDEVTLFLHKVESDMPPERQQMLKSARSREKAFEGRTILVVDDDVRNVFALTSALEQKGAMVDIARNGIEAVEKARNNPDIDLVLMDIMMPEMDGFAAMEEIRKEPRLAKLPIIAVTAKAMKNDQERCLRAGANDYLAKPIELDRLFSLIRVWLPKVELL